MLHTYITRDFDLGIETVSSVEDGGERTIISRNIMEPLCVVSNRANVRFELGEPDKAELRLPSENAYGDPYDYGRFCCASGTNPTAFVITAE